MSWSARADPELVSTVTDSFSDGNHAFDEMNPWIPPPCMMTVRPARVSRDSPKPQFARPAAPSGVVMRVYDSGETTCPVPSARFHRARSATVEHNAPAAYG